MFSCALVVTSACRLISVLGINPKQASQAVDIAHDCVEARVPVWSTGGKPQIAVFQADPLRLEVYGAADAIATKTSK
jgi:hypothetical protein